MIDAPSLIASMQATSMHDRATGRFLQSYEPQGCPTCAQPLAITSHQAGRVYYFACANAHKFKALMVAKVELVALAEKRQEPALSPEDAKAWRALVKKMRGVPDKRRAPRSPEVKAKLAAALKGRKWKPDALAKRIASQTGAKRSPEACARQSARLKGSPLPKAAIAASVAARKGKPLSAEHRAKLVAAQAARRERAKHEKWYGRKG